MKESIGSVFLYNIIFVFIIIVFGLITATLSYYKAFKVNKAILGYISRYSGYNTKSETAIKNYLESVGYTTDGTKCSDNEKAGGVLVNKNNNGYYYCVYYHNDETGKNEKNGNESKTNADGQPIYYAYGVTTFIYIDLPIAGNFKIPVYTKGERIYNFSDGQSQKVG